MFSIRKTLIVIVGIIASTILIGCSTVPYNIDHVRTEVRISSDLHHNHYGFTRFYYQTYPRWYIERPHRYYRYRGRIYNYPSSPRSLPYYRDRSQRLNRTERDRSRRYIRKEK